MFRLFHTSFETEQEIATPFLAYESYFLEWKDMHTKKLVTIKMIAYFNFVKHCQLNRI